MKTLRFGVEIETVGISRQQLANAIQTVVGGRVLPGPDGYTVADERGRNWSVVRDGSLSGVNNGEIVTPILEWTDIEQLQDVVRAVRAAGARADSSCGIHIHVDGSRFDAKAITNLVKMVNKQEALIESAIRLSSDRRSRYCQPIDQSFLGRLEQQRPQSMDQVRAAWYGSAHHRPTRYDYSRYHGLNLNSLFYRGTIEWRLFNGTLHAGEVKAYVHLVLAIAHKALSAKSAASRKRTLDPATARYDLRVFLLRLGFIGPEFKSTRMHLMKHLGGSAAWKGTRRDRARVAPTSAAGGPEGNGSYGAPVAAASPEVAA